MILADWFNRMRDAEIGNLYGEGIPAIAVATHDQGVVGVVRRTGSGFDVQELDRQANRFVHEIELGDLNTDGAMEVYATPSEPNTLAGNAATWRRRAVRPERRGRRAPTYRRR